MIKVNSISKSIDGRRILRDANMHIPKGSIYGLVGPNGAGKSTIIRHIVGSMKPDSGEITIDGQTVYENPDAKSRIAFVPDDIFYYVTDNITSLMKLYKSLYPTFDTQRYESLIEAFPELNTKKLIRSYSKGMQRQAAFLLALCTHADVMILDEPLDGLDPVMRRQVLGFVVDDVSSRGTSVLISSHNLRELEDICDHVGIMDGGHIIIERALSDLVSSVTKFQIAFGDNEVELPNELDIIHKVVSGRVQTIIVKGDADVATAKIEALNPVIMDIIPLTLEEIFIYEMGGAGYGNTQIHLD